VIVRRTVTFDRRSGRGCKSAARLEDEVTRVRALVAAISLMTALLWLSTAAAADQEVGAIDFSSQYQMDRAAYFRSTLGLDSSSGTTSAAGVDRVGYPDTSWGVPLSKSEAAEVGRRALLQIHLVPAEEYALSQKSFAGMWIDQLSGATPVFQFASDPEPFRASIESLVPKGTPYGLRAVSRSLEELQAVKDAIVADFDSLAEIGVQISGVGLSIENNAVAVHVASLTSDVMKVLQTRYGSGLLVDEMPLAQADSCPRTSCLPLKGGIEIDGLNPSTQYCTSGFLVRRTDVSPQTLNVLTAGHCVQFANDTTHNWTHSGTAIGPNLLKNSVKVETWQSNAVADVGLIKVISYPSTRDNLLTDESPVTIRPVYAYELHQYQSVGSIVCRMGRTSYLDCGTILDNDETKPSVVGSSSVNILHTVVVSFDSIAGDSGGPVFVTVDEPGEGLHTYAYGTHVDSERPDGVGKHGWYSPFDYAISALQTIHGVSIVLCTTTSCGLP
jgi:hypothetical protein